MEFVDKNTVSNFCALQPRSMKQDLPENLSSSATNHDHHT
jgi:hypothetical protein